MKQRESQGLTLSMYELEMFAEQAKDLREQRARLLKELAALAGVKPFPSEANMILVRVPDAAKTFEGLKAQGVLTARGR
jgi:histidinol-phosphate aminotransferase